MLELAGELMVDGEEEEEEEEEVEDDEEDAMEQGGGDADGPWNRRRDRPPEDEDESSNRRSRNRARFERFVSNAAIFTRSRLLADMAAEGEESSRDADDEQDMGDNGRRARREERSGDGAREGAREKDRRNSNGRKPDTKDSDESDDDDEDDSESHRREQRGNGAFGFSIKRAFRNPFPKERKRQHNRRSESEPTEKQPGKSTSRMEDFEGGAEFSHEPDKRKNGKTGNGLNGAKSASSNPNGSRPMTRKRASFLEEMEEDSKMQESSKDDAPESDIENEMDATNADDADESIDFDGILSDASSSSELSDEGIFQSLKREKEEQEEAERKEKPIEPSHLSIKIQRLPLPKALISFLLYHRDISE